MGGGVRAHQGVGDHVQHGSGPDAQAGVGRGSRHQGRGLRYARYFGGAHNACGSRGYIRYNAWNKVTYRGITGYVPSSCTLPFKP